MTNQDFSQDYERPETSGLTRRSGSGFWVHTMHEGRIVIFGPYTDEQSASEYGFRHFGSNFDVEWLPTRDTNRATKMLKKQLYDRTDELDLALKRARHKV